MYYTIIDKYDPRFYAIIIPDFCRNEKSCLKKLGNLPKFT